VREVYQARANLNASPHALGRGLALARSIATVSVLGWSVVAAGVVARAARFADNRALWYDEAMLALNVIERGFLDLLRPLDYTQAAPPLFLLLEKLAVSGLGESEPALRLVPFLAGVTALILFRQLTARVLPGLGGLVALGLFAAAEPLVYWSAEAKQYSLDVLAAVALLYVASEPLLTGRLTGRRAAVLAAIGALAVFASYASVFVLAGIAAALVLGPLVGRRRPSTTTLAVSATWLLSGAVLFIVMVGTTREIRAALELGTGDFMTPLELARDAWRGFSDPGPFARTTVGVAVLAAALGVVFLRRRCPAFLAAVAVTLVATIAAAQADLYPFFTRFILFLVPVVLLLVGAGVQELHDATAGRTRMVWVTALLLLTAYPAGVAVQNVFDPPKVEETRDVLRPMEAKWRPGDSLFVARLAQPALAYYAECEACGVLDGKPSDDLRRLVLSARSRASEKGLRAGGRLAVGDVDHHVPYSMYASHFARFRGERRVWVLLSSGWDHRFTEYVLDCLGRRTEAFESTNAAAYLYDFSRLPAGSEGECRPLIR
jgi:hypothetical protein